MSLDETDNYFCEGCGKHSSALKILTFIHLPETLTIQLKKFAYNSEENQAVKVNTMVNYSTEEIEVGSDTFDLFAVLVDPLSD